MTAEKKAAGTVHNVRAVTRALDVLNSFAGKGHWNFALDDCDRILRIQCADGVVEPASVISLMSRLGYHAALLPDCILKK